MKKSSVAMFLVMVVVIAAVYFAWQGYSLHRQVSGEEAAFHELQSAYFTVSKEERDAATTGSELNQQLIEIKNYPSELLRLKLLGLGHILIGIFLLLLSILITLIVMPIRLARIIRKG